MIWRRQVIGDTWPVQLDQLRGLEKEVDNKELLTRLQRVKYVRTETVVYPGWVRGPGGQTPFPFEHFFLLNFFTNTGMENAEKILGPENRELENAWRDSKKVKVWTLAIAPLTWVRLVTSSALQSRKWQLIAMSQRCRSTLCGHPLPALTDNWTHGAASRYTLSPQSATPGLHPVAVATTHFPYRQCSFPKRKKDRNANNGNRGRKRK